MAQNLRKGPSGNSLRLGLLYEPLDLLLTQFNDWSVACESLSGEIGQPVITLLLLLLADRDLLLYGLLKHLSAINRHDEGREYNYSTIEAANISDHSEESVRAPVVNEQGIRQSKHKLDVRLSILRLCVLLFYLVE